MSRTTDLRCGEKEVRSANGEAPCLHMRLAMRGVTSSPCKVLITQKVRREELDLVDTSALLSLLLYSLRRAVF